MDENRDYKLVVFSPLWLMPSIWVSWICVVAVLKFITEALVNKNGFLIGGVFCFCFLISINLWFFYRFHFATVKSKNHTKRGI
ncbi:MAG: hypothetical protein ACO1N8_11365 [Methylophilus sp.]